MKSTNNSANTSQMQKKARMVLLIGRLNFNLFNDDAQGGSFMQKVKNLDEKVKSFDTGFSSK